MKRLIPILLIVCLLPGLLAVPATGAEAAPVCVYDLLTAVEYNRSDSTGFSDISPRASLYLTKATYAEFSWVPPVSFEVDRIELAVESKWRPLFVYIWDGGKLVPCTHKSSYDGVHYFYLDGLSAVSPYRVRVIFAADFTGTVALRSVYGYVDRAIDVDKCDYFTNVILGIPSIGARQVLAVDSGQALLPVASQWDGPHDYSGDERMLYAECYYKVSAPIGYAQSISYLVYTIGEIDNLGVRIEKSDGNIVAAVSSSVEPCGDSQIIVDLNGEMYRCKVYQITADLIGYDLSDCVVTLSYEVVPVAAPGFTDVKWGFYSQLTAAAFLPMASEDGLFTRFTFWLGNHLDDIQSSLDKIADAMTTTDPGSDQIKDDLDQAGNELSGLGDVMNSVSRPDLGDVALDIDRIVPSSDLAASLSPLAPLFDNPYIFSTFSLSFLFALVAFVFFGKR